MLALLLTVLTGGPVVEASAQPPQKGEPPQKMELFAKEGWYKEQKGQEKEFTGVLQRVDRGKGVVGFGRFNPYRLQMDKDVREFYVGGKMELLAPYVGKRVKLRGALPGVDDRFQQHLTLRLSTHVGEKADLQLRRLERAPRLAC